MGVSSGSGGGCTNGPASSSGGGGGVSCCDMSMKCWCRWRWEHQLQHNKFLSLLFSSGFVFFLGCLVLYGTIGMFYGWLVFGKPYMRSTAGAFLGGGAGLNSLGLSVFSMAIPRSLSSQLNLWMYGKMRLQPGQLLIQLSLVLLPLIQISPATLLPTYIQMLSGTSPFKDASEWLIFQRIIARDLRFPNYFSEAARDLIDRLLDIYPSRRPGAGPDGYMVLKTHPFFKGIDWENLRERTPPKLVLEAMSGEGDRDHSHDSSLNPGDNKNDGSNVGVSSSSEASGHVTRLASIDSFDSKWQQFLDQGESVIMIAMVKKLQKLTSKKVQLILTDKPKLIYVDPSKLLVKGNII